ncbi:MAG: hypothetical protein RIM84_27230 [Alphaproteobacteria bacterium]
MIARSWFPKVDKDVEKWKVPCCIECNNKKSKIESDTMHKLAMCLSGDDPSYADILSKVKRSRDPKSATNAKDIVHRLNRKFRTLREIRPVHSRSQRGALPYFRENFDAGSRLGILISKKSLDHLIGSWVRGIHYSELGKLIPTSREVDVMHVTESGRKFVHSNIGRFGEVIKKGPGMEVTIYHAEEDDKSETYYQFSIWGGFEFSAWISEKANS